MTPLYQALSALAACSGPCLPSPLHLLQPSTPPLSSSPPSLFHTLILSAHPPTPLNPRPLSCYHHFCSTAPSLLSPLTVNNFALVLFFLQSFFFLPPFFFLRETFVGAPRYLLWEARSGYRRRVGRVGRGVGAHRWWTNKMGFLMSDFILM